MSVFSGTPPPTCPSSRHCTEWARTYLKYCLCSLKDSAALALGLISVISWGVAEVPQIITNYRQKSTEGLSIAFLMTWIVGDLFNLVGCFLEPATLPTQFYMALLYTITTVILTGQTIYYSHIYHHLKAKESRATSKPQKHQRGDTSLCEKLLSAKDGGASRNNHQSDATIPIPSSPIPVNTKIAEQYHTPSSPTSDYYYMSARSLSRSPVPTAGTWLDNSRQSSRTPPQTNGQRVPLIGEITTAQSASLPLIGEITTAQSASPTRTKNALSVVPWLGLLFSTCLLHLLVGNTHREVPSGTVIPVGRRLLLFKDDQGHSSFSHGSGSEIGSFLGWAMAIIYMGGRLPQIFLNMQRGHVEGLNPLMFTFALLGNSTCVGSILVNSLEWSKLRPNLPWLVDAGVCVLLDSFIILQFLYFHYRKQNEPSDEHDNADKA
ncbi:hypothetical protein PVAP13_5KG178000 [Panicum virgatum]|uniref:PQ-loop repeat family protein / transmembrane family protein n=1 Tax=Panicum virgatum TaxID=38727 RepID=A0A8T0SK53_PANVG|nr:hypothetical protein PVAP13_5KG178000 [Panicum virgatum]KAG2596670.1 hypothetical protein PVAP13_5KG178000 [Panicum virgatum]KAG2596671.1 hypothetical protein PVAP13_5KG178000 [Panicum virgatum]KAG2596672.1 hypothetical protein PVAP13_5KG178000 [Panicum virgatum]KAG2596679.1 hypothetical protein PVAP13_5KG178000 [Panicum virgatum]